MGAVTRYEGGATGIQTKVTDQGNGFPVVDSVPGVALPDIASWNHAVVDCAAAANQVLVAAPGANKQIWVLGLRGAGGTGTGTITFQDEDDTALSGTVAIGAGLVLNWVAANVSRPIFKVATNKALEADLATSTFDGVIEYIVVNV